MVAQEQLVVARLNRMELIDAQALQVLPHRIGWKSGLGMNFGWQVDEQLHSSHL